MERIVVPVTTPAAVAAIAALSARPGTEVVAVAVEVGNATPLDALREAALAAGARACHGVDARASLAADVLWPAVASGALGVAGEPLVTALSMVAVAQAAVAAARHDQATSLAAWAEDARERQRLHALLKALAPSLGVVTVRSSAPALVAQNIWARVQVLGDSDGAGPMPESAPKPADVLLTVGFAQGRAVALNGVAMTPAALVMSLDAIGRAHGVRPLVVRGDGAGSRRWQVQAPAALALHRAGESLRARVLDDRAEAFADTVAVEYATLIRDGLWFTALRAGLDAFVERVLAPATGDVTMRVAHGDIEVQG
ncbi:MAG: argininosuccinate synthase domain-containing protein [Acidobacteriota bacterium]